MGKPKAGAVQALGQPSVSALIIFIDRGAML
jgi:hypothetical protein